MTLRTGILAAAGLFALFISAAAIPTPAAAQAYGSAAENTHRDCGVATAADRCDGTLGGQTIIEHPITGGVSSSANTTLSLADGSFANSTVGFGAFDLPVLRGETSAVGNERMNINAFGYQTYTYTGAADAPFSISGNLHIVDSSVSDLTNEGAPDPLNPGFTQFGGWYPGGSIGTAYVGVWDTSILGSFTSAQSIFDNLFLAQCDAANPHILGAGMVSHSLTGGDANIGVSTTACTATSLILTPGETVLVVAGLQLPTNRGGFADATHTFTTAFGDDVTDAVKTDLMSGRDTLGVPEPAGWAMMILGFFGTGAVLRRRASLLAA
jgi:hypothetical protein